MRRISLLILLVLGLSLGACSSDEENTTVCKLEGSSNETLQIEYDGNVVTSLEIQHDLYADESAKSDEMKELAKAYDELKKEANKIAGLSYDYTMEDNMITESYLYTFKNVDLEEQIDLYNFLSDHIKENKDGDLYVDYDSLLSALDNYTCK